MYNYYDRYLCPYYLNVPIYNPYPYLWRQFTGQYIPSTGKIQDQSRFDFLQSMKNNTVELKDYGPDPFTIDINEATKQNDTFRTALWTGDHLQLTLMSIDVGEDIGLERHPNTDQFIRIEEGEGIVQMGDSQEAPNFEEEVYDDFAIIIPAGKWHNLINTGNKPLKLYSIYAPPQHPKGTVHETKADAEAAEESHQ